MSDILTAIYGAGADGDCIALLEGPLEVWGADYRIQGSGTARLCFQPRLDVVIDGVFPDDEMFTVSRLFDVDRVEYSLGRPDRLVVGKASARSAMGATARLVPNPQVARRSAPDRQAHNLVFHVVNFPLFLGPTDARLQYAKGGWRRLGRVFLRDDEWEIELQELPEAKAAVERLKAQGGYGLTHVGKLVRRDGATFAPREADTVLQNLYLFLSFARGAWSSPILSVGFDEAGDRVSEEWGTRITTPWETSWRWFDVNHAEALTELYQRFRALLHHSTMGAAVSAALYWYLRSNRGGEGAGIDSGVILGQAALERLAHAYLDTHGMVMPKRSNAAARLRAVLQHLSIPIDIPASLRTLNDGGLKDVLKDGPEAITCIRNELVHPGKRLPVKAGHLAFEAWNLSQWYIDLIILRLADYKGSYANRLKTGRWVGELEKVPWA